MMKTYDDGVVLVIFPEIIVAGDEVVELLHVLEGHVDAVLSPFDKKSNTRVS